jgi:protein-tyrosine phosphatase
MRKTVVELFNIVLLRECNDTLVLDDPKPGVKEITSLVLHQISSLDRKLRTRLQSAKISRKVRSGQFKRAVLHAVTILFVCRGNICRSPFAERYSRNTLPKNLQISSCGYIRQNGREPPPEATSAAIKFGVNLSDHQAHEVTEEMLQNSDMIIVFDESNFRILADRYKDYKRKIWFLSEICPDLPLFIEDPFRKNGESCEKVYSVIGYCIDEINHWLKENSS